MSQITSVEAEGLPHDPGDGTKPVAWWGTILFIATEAMLFGALISSYIYLRYNATVWPLGDIEPPELTLAIPATIVLLASSGLAHLAESRIRKGDETGLRWALVGTIGLGLCFLAIQVTEYAGSSFTPLTNAYGSIFFGVTGFHGLHVLVGVAMLTSVVTAARRPGRFTPERHIPVRTTVMYWHFVDVVWIVVFTTLYLSERL